MAPAESLPTWLDSFARCDTQKPISFAPKNGPTAPAAPVASSGGYAAPEVPAAPAAPVAEAPEAPPEKVIQTPLEMEEEEDAFIRKQDSRTMLGPAASKRTDDEYDAVRRVGSLSCFRDVSGYIAEEEIETTKPEYEGKNSDVPVIIVTSEVNPFSKTGGLALVAQSYGMEFPKRGHRTMVVSPMYDHYPNCEFVGQTKIWLMGGETEVKFFYQHMDHGAGVSCDYVFVDHPCYKRPGGLYYNAQLGVEYEDNLFRFALFSLAALEVTKLHLGGKGPYGNKVLFMANDWQAALLPVYLVHRHRPRHEFTESRCIFVVHNFGYQGIYPLNKLVPSDSGPLPVIIRNVGLEDLGLDPAYTWNDMIYEYPPHERQYEGDDGKVINLSKAALMTSDRILTVSPGYACEMKTEAGGFRLQEVANMRNFHLAGILNGIDTGHWNPSTDTNLNANYDANYFVPHRATNKKQLQERLGLRVDPDIALVSFVGRLTDQKGIDMIIEAIDWLMKDTGNGVTGHVQLLMMGHGDAHFAEGLKGAEQKHPGLVCGYVGFDPQVEHIVYGGSDLFLMPSRYEPCGLPQMYAMRYGCIPVVTLCGGLKDSVVTEPPEEATGFGIHPLTDGKFKEVTYKALECYFRDKEQFQAMQERGMRKDFSWCRALDQYEQNIDWTLGDKPYVH